MDLSELEDLREYSELDLLYKLIDVAKGNVKRTEQFMKGNKTAGVDVRQSMQDIRLLAEFIRDSIQVNKGSKKVKIGKYKGEEISLLKLEKSIIDKKESLKKEESNIIKTRNLRASKLKEK